MLQYGTSFGLDLHPLCDARAADKGPGSGPVVKRLRRLRHGSGVMALIRNDIRWKLGGAISNTAAIQHVPKKCPVRCNWLEVAA